MDKNIKAIIFDLDGTLYPMTLLFKPLFAINCLPNPFRLPKYMKLRSNYRGAERDSVKEMLDDINRDVESQLSVKDGKEWHQKHFYPAFVKTLSLNSKRPKIVSLLSSLKEKGYKLVVLSDFGAVKDRLKALSIPLELFELTLSSEDFGAFKPSPIPFEKTLELLDLPKGSVLFVGDRDDTDGLGCERVGLKFIKVSGNTNKNWEKEIEILYNLPRIVDRNS